ncbi:GntR family transcriptional regulator [Pseudoroseomonas globiformis]|uniref:GntR family transcriptional regulator n=1 Tax=Teichococcus globiformis TaxID=2307229 RepID=A0ABV7FZ06_9PROT
MAASPLDRLAGMTTPRRTAAEHVEAALRSAILEGHLPAGLALRQEDLAARFGLSRMPVREALRRLEAQALAESVPHKGTVVAEISAAAIADSFAIRAGLEPEALRLSAPRLTPSDLDAGADLITQMEGEDDLARLGEWNRRFHCLLYARAGHARLLRLIDQELAVFDRHLRFLLAMRGRERMAQDDHRAMLQALRLGDGAAAVAVLQHHIRGAAAEMASLLEAEKHGAGRCSG